MSIIPTPRNAAEPTDIIEGVMAYIVVANFPDARMEAITITRRYMLHKSHPQGVADGRHVFDLRGMKCFADEYNLERGSRKNKRKHVWLFTDYEAATTFYSLVQSLRAEILFEIQHAQVMKRIGKA